MKVKKFSSILLAFLLFLSNFAPTALAVTESKVSSLAETVLGDAVALEKLSDPDTSIPTFSNAINELSGDPVENGRIWTDKSVNADRALIHNTAGKPVDSVSAEEDEFLITLSALSQSFTVDTIVEPSDTVFAIDVSGSMASNTVGTTGRTRIDVLVEALNEAIKMLMDANPNNRVAVVAYGGHSVSGQNASKIVPILRLDHHHVSNGIYFSMSNSNTVQVSSQIPDSALFAAANRNIRVEGGTPTQRGIYRGAQVLLENTDTTFTTTVDGEEFTLIRRPNIILMTDGDPTYGWTDYQFANTNSDTDPGFDSGNGSTSDLGMALLTTLTASYVKQQVHDHYYDGGTTRSVGFYTIGLGVDSDIVRAALDPYGNSATPGKVNADLVNQTFSGNTYNMRTLLDSFSAGESITFPVLNRNSSSQRSLRTVENTNSFVKNCHYADLSFSAMDVGDLKDAFEQIAQQIVSRGSYSTNTNPDPNAPSGEADFGGYLIFSDVLGEYMEFRGLEGLWYENVRYDGDDFANDLMNNTGNAQAEFISVLKEHLDDTTGASISPTEAQALLDSNIAAGQANPIKYYADADRNFVGSFFNPDGSPATQPENATTIVERYSMRGEVTNPVTQQATDLMYITFHVVTALEDGSYEEVFSNGTYLVRNLKAGDQVIRWYIPASLIPQRTVTSIKGEDNIPTGEVQVVETVPIQVIYAVGLDTERVLAGISDEYKKVNEADVEDAYYFYTNRWGNLTAPNNSLAFFRPSNESPYYFEGFYTTKGAQMKTENRTETVGHSWEGRFFDVGDNRVQMHWLGNNGRLMMDISLPPEPSKTFDLWVQKLFNGLEESQIPQNFELIITGPDGFEERVIGLSDVRAGVLFENIPLGVYTINERNSNVPGFTIEASPVMPHTFTVDEADLKMNLIITNTYTPDPPGPPGPPDPPGPPGPPNPPGPPGPEPKDPPSPLFPQTGDNNSRLGIFIAMLIASIGSMSILKFRRRFTD